MDADSNGLGSLPDEDLVKLTQAGSNPAFSELMRRHYPSCLKVAQSILRDREDAEDEVQNACWKSYSHIGQFQYDAKFSTWLTRIVVNQCLMRLRQIKRARSTYIEDWNAGEDMAAIEPRDHRDTPEMDLGRREVMEVVRQEIAGIPPLLRNVFVLRDVEELPMPAVAEQLGISVAAAKSRLLRARSEFRNRLLRHFSKLGPSSLIAS